MKSLTYSDVCLVPNFSACASRSSGDPSVELFGARYKLPIIPANMKSVISEEQCRWLAQNGYFYIMHRFDIDVQHFIEEANRELWPLISVSLGVKPEDKQVVYNLRVSGARIDFITLDIAHGHLSLMREMIKYCHPSGSFRSRQLGRRRSKSRHWPRLSVYDQR